MADDEASAIFLAELEAQQGRIELTWGATCDTVADDADNGAMVENAGAEATDNVEDAQCRDDGASPDTPGADATPCVRRSCAQCALPVRAEVVAQIRSGNTLKCNSCNSKNVILHRMFGQWPIDGSKELDETERQTFWRESVPKKEHLFKNMTDVLTKKIVEAQQKSKGGAYLPLTVYAMQGFNVDDISARCTDTCEDPVLGTCYKVDIMRVDGWSLEMRVRTKLLKLRGMEPPGEEGETSRASNSTDFLNVSGAATRAPTGVGGKGDCILVSSGVSAQARRVEALRGGWRKRVRARARALGAPRRDAARASRGQLVGWATTRYRCEMIGQMITSS